MNLQVAGEKLRLARETQGRTLDDIAAATRINRASLQQIEEGAAPNLPATYVRAFIRGYALQVGLDPEEMLADETPDTTPPLEIQPKRLSATKSASTQFSTQDAAGPSTVHTRTNKQGKVVMIVGAFLLVGLILSMFFLRSNQRPQPVQEISFSDAVSEHEAKYQDSVTVGAGHEPDSRHVVGAKTDSLLLEAIAIDTVWVRMGVDQIAAEEYTFPPKHRMQWKARDQFLISVGNGKAVSFTLNGRKIGTLGTSDRPVRNARISREDLKLTEPNVSR